MITYPELLSGDTQRLCHDTVDYGELVAHTYFTVCTNASSTYIVRCNRVHTKSCQRTFICRAGSYLHLSMFLIVVYSIYINIQYLPTLRPP